MAFYDKVDQAIKRLKTLETERDEIDNRLSTKQAATTNQVEIDRLQREREENWQRHEKAIISANNEILAADDLQKQQELAKTEASMLRLAVAKARAKTDCLLQGISEDDFESTWWPKILEKKILSEVETVIKSIPESSVTL